VYVDALVERDQGAQRYYVQQDANYNVTAITDALGNVRERYALDPYGGSAVVLTASWGQIPASLYSWVYLHQGGRYDGETGLYDFRNRFYDPEKGRWLNLDPLGFDAGDSNLYRYEGNEPTVAGDPSGLRPMIINVNTVALYVGKGGAIAWFVDFELDQPAAGKKDRPNDSGGWIIQEIRGTVHVERRGPTDTDEFGRKLKGWTSYPSTPEPAIPGTYRLHYLEAFRVWPEEKSPPSYTKDNINIVLGRMSKSKYFSGIKREGLSFDDVFYWIPNDDDVKLGGEGTCGEITIEGSLYYFDDVGRYGLHPAFKVKGGAAGAGGLPSVELLKLQNKETETALKTAAELFNREKNITDYLPGSGARPIGPFRHKLVARWNWNRDEKTQIASLVTPTGEYRGYPNYSPLDAFQPGSTKSVPRCGSPGRVR
jgi:RHS repeat-associated protein